MQFTDLYNFCQSEIERNRAEHDRSIVLFDSVKLEVERNLDWIGGINTHGVETRDGDPLGHYELYCEREDRWDDPETWVSVITYDKELNICKRRFVWFKEIMHVFDGPDTETDSPEKYFTLMSDIETRPIAPSTAYVTELQATWMALLALCPKPFRDEAIERLKPDGDATSFDIALEYRIPESVISALVSKGYDDAYTAYVLN